MQQKKSGRNIIIIVILLLSLSGFLYIRYLKTKNPKPTAKSESVIDITPLLVEKLQQLVTQASDSLYSLSIEELKPDIISSQVDIINAKLIPDSSVLQKLIAEQKAPDDVFTISLQNIHITGLGSDNFLHTKNISLNTIFISSPHIQISHTEHLYNAAQRKKEGSLTLYQKLTKQFQSIAVRAILVKDGSFTSTDVQQHKTNKLNKVNIALADLAIDSSTQYDTSRFLFCKKAILSSLNYATPTPDSLYLFTIDSFSVVANQHLLTAKDVAIKPRGNKEQFERKLKTRGDMFTVRFPSVVCRGIDWWTLVNKGSIYADNITINNSSVKDYFDRSLPVLGKPSPKNNYPQQLLQQAPVKVSIKQLDFHQFDVSYEEYSPESKRSGMVTFDRLSGSIKNITNIASEIKDHPLTVCTATGFFMKSAPLNARFVFDLSKIKSGAFMADFRLGEVKNTVLNPMAEPMGLYTVSSGTVNKTSIHIAADNYTARTKITMLYNDLKIVPLKNPDSSGHLKKRNFLGFIANTFVIKNSNPSGKKKEPRSPDVTANRDEGGSFFNFLWKAILTGIVKTINLPKKFAD